MIGVASLMSTFVKVYYYLTAYIPRPLPRTEIEIVQLKEVFIKYFGLEDNPQVWYTVFSNMASVKATKTRVFYGSLVNIARRLTINKFLQDQKQLEMEKHMATLEEKLKDKLDEAKANGEVQNPEEPLLPPGPSDT